MLILGALLVFGGIVLGGASSSRFGVPFLLIFLLVGMLAGVDGLGGIEFDDYELSFLFGNLALAVILLDGGLRTDIATFRVALKPSLVLATFGVLGTAVVVAAFAVWLLNIDWRLALLLGTVIASTDAAAVFSLLRSSGTRLNQRIGSTLEIESGINDPMAIFLTIALIGVITAGQPLSVSSMLMQLLQQFGIGALVGVIGGLLLNLVAARVRPGEGLHALLLCSGGVSIFAITNIAGGSGFLAVYLVGLVVGNYREKVAEPTMRAMDGMAWLGQSGMFLLLGLLVVPRDMLEVAVPGLAIALFLMFVARPAAVFVCLLPFRFKVREMAFISWVGLRGAVPIVMAIFPLLAGVEGAGLVFNVAFVVVLLSLMMQGTSIPAAARLFGTDIPGKAEPLERTPLKGASHGEHELVQFRVEHGSPLAGAGFRGLELPGDARVVSIARSDVVLAPVEAGQLQDNDIVSVIAPGPAVDKLGELFHSEEKAHRKEQRSFYGDFLLEGGAKLEDVAALYGDPSVDRGLQTLTLDAAIRKKLRRYAVQGDTVRLCGLQFTVRSVDRGQVAKVGVGLATGSGEKILEGE